MTDSTTTTPVLVFVEHAIWQPGDDWADAIDHLATRFARVAPLDADAVRSGGTFADQVAQVAAWATPTDIDLDRELGRWFDEHLAMFVRPAPTVTRAVRAIAAANPVHVVSALPPRAAEAVTRHAGCWRSVAELHGDVHTAEQLRELVARVEAGRVVADAVATPLPDGLAASSLANA